MYSKYTNMIELRKIKFSAPTVL